MRHTGEGAVTYFDAAAIDVQSHQTDLVRASETSAVDATPSRLLWLVVLTHLFSAGAFSLATAFTCRFILFTRLWFGGLVGLFIYGLIVTVQAALEWADLEH